MTIIGDKGTFAVECYHEPLANEGRRVFGRMCIWAGGTQLGDINEPSCMLNVTEGHLQDTLARLDSLDDPVLGTLGDREAFDLLNRALYIDDARPVDQVTADARRFRKFDFLTNGGESFDHSKSFIMRRDGRVCILFAHDSGEFGAAHVERAAFESVVRGFLAWLAEEGKSAG